MHKILTFTLPNDESKEKEIFDQIEIALDAELIDGFKLVNSLWDADDMHNGQGAQMILFLRKD